MLREFSGGKATGEEVSARVKTARRCPATWQTLLTFEVI